MTKNNAWRIGLLWLGCVMHACSGDAASGGDEHGSHDHPGEHQPPEVPVPDTVAQAGVARLWSDPETWGGAVPDRDSVVEIPAGTSVVLDENACVRGLLITGELSFADRDLTFCARYVMVHGRLAIGSATQPFAHRAEITLLGSDEAANVLGMGTKYLGAMSGGVLDLHGATPPRAWSLLASPARAGDRAITVVDATGWTAGSEIAIASGVVDPGQIEARIIKAVTGNTLELDQPLRHAHGGARHTVDNRVVDTRPEVALLSRRIVIQGDEDSAKSAFGGHVMVMRGGQAFVEGIELRRMGQFDHLGRYPFHWHIAGDVQGQYLRKSVVNRSLQRGVIVHDAHHALVEDNIVFDSMGHNFLAETDTTTDNVYRGNLALGNRIAKHTTAGLIAQHDNAPANFWIRSARNSFENNHAAGSIGSGFWYDNTNDGPTMFKDNVGHSSAGAGVGFDFVRDSGLLVQLALETSETLVFQDSTFYANAISLWPSEASSRYENFIIASVGGGPLVTAEAVGADVTFKDTLFVGALPGQEASGGAAVFIQYGARVHLDAPVFANYGDRSVLFSNDIFVPWQAEFFLAGARFLATNPAAATPPEQGLVTAMDDSFLPRGLYIPDDQRPLVTPSMTMATLGSSDEQSNYFRGATALKFGVLRSSAFSDGARLRRSDGFEFADSGYGGWRVVAGGDLHYALVAPPTGSDLRIRLDVSLAPGQGGAIGDWVDVTVPLAAAPRRVEDLGPEVDGQQPDDAPAPIALSPANSTSAPGAAPEKTYFYDAATRQLHLRVGTSSLRIVR